MNNTSLARVLSKPCVHVKYIIAKKENFCHGFFSGCQSTRHSENVPTDFPILRRKEAMDRQEFAEKWHLLFRIESDPTYLSPIFQDSDRDVLS